MTPILSVLVLLALLIVFAVPAFVAWLRPRAGSVVAGFYALLFAALGVYYVGLPVFGSDSTAEAMLRQMSSTSRGSTAPPAGMCASLLQQARDVGLLIDQTPQRATVDRNMWAQFPEQAKGAFAACLRTAQPSERRTGEIAIVEADRR